MKNFPTIYKEQFINTPKINKYLGAPFIIGMIIPLVFLDICLEIYHNICFRLYGLKMVNRKEYIFIDRHKLSKLTPVQKLYCVYCGYGNGLLPYAAKIASETEKYWCAIKHESSDAEKVQPQQKEFIERAEFE
jgi:hypothetical protein